ncbi:ABC transporter permease [Subtercola lobariae]|uniref:Permease n=1 Tax=Subtercola lobariae TaxID=1588641 RepID=A0A917EY89_9MICO|nr:ABC transporter permease [Subtercola lobariae]GGF23742.1 permease [Subtercola lobariae]
MNFVDIFRTAVSNTFRSRLRTTLTVVAIFIGAFTLTITTAIGTGVSDYINKQVASVGASDVLLVSKTSDQTTTGTDTGPAKYDPTAAKAAAGGGLGAGAPGQATTVLTQADLTTIGQTSGVLSVDPIVTVTPDYIQYGDNGKYVLTVSATSAFTKADLAAGAQLSSTDQTLQVMLPLDYLSNLGFSDAASAVGQPVTIGITDYAGTQHEVTATVVGVQNTTLLGGGVGLNQYATTQLHDLQSTGKPANSVAGYSRAVAHIDPNSSKSQISAIKDSLKTQGYTALTVADQIGTFETVINGIIGVLDAFAVIALIAAGFGIINTLLMSVQERTREIGLMKAMGMSGRKVYALFSTEAVFIGFLGSAIGAGVAILVGSVISSVLSKRLLSGLPGLHLLEFSPVSILIIILVVMLIAFLAGTLPARRAARQNPIDALRYE